MLHLYYFDESFNAPSQSVFRNRDPAFGCADFTLRGKESFYPVTSVQATALPGPSKFKLCQCTETDKICLGIFKREKRGWVLKKLQKNLKKMFLF